MHVLGTLNINLSNYDPSGPKPFTAPLTASHLGDTASLSYHLSGKSLAPELVQSTVQSQKQLQEESKRLRKEVERAEMRHKEWMRDGEDQIRD